MSTRAKILVSLFLTMHLGAYAIRISPLAITAKMVRFELGGERLSLYDLARWYQAYTVTAVSGQLFAPLPARSNVHIGARVELADGGGRDFLFPRPQDETGLAAKRNVFFHKLGMSLTNEDNAVYYADLCRYVARQFATNGSRPVRVQLIAFHAPIPRHSRPEVHLRDGAQWFDYTQMLRQQAHYEENTLHEYTVQPEDFA
ncbi:MAG TPA: hypothetical protein VEB21_07670 [Terriglobales bacterium]|nr:hypothetical protein [Terriglobales bacterium]